MATGKVKWFNDQRDLVLSSRSQGRDVFVHHSVIEGQGFKTLQENETVEYEFEDGPKGMKAPRFVGWSALWFPGSLAPSRDCDPTRPPGGFLFRRADRAPSSLFCAGAGGFGPLG